MTEVKVRVHRGAEGVGTYVDAVVIIQQDVYLDDALPQRVERELRAKKPWIFASPVREVEIREIWRRDTVVFVDGPRIYPVAG